MRRRLLSFVASLPLLPAQTWSERVVHPITVTGLVADAVPGHLLLLEDLGRFRTWTVVGNTFLPRQDVSPPPRRQDFALVHDSRRRRVLLIGGATDAVSFVTDTWAWDGVRWTQLAASPPPRHSHALAYDAARDRVVLHGGYAQQLPPPWGPTPAATTHEFDGTTWRQIGANGPARADHRLGYDPVRQRTVLFGGQDNGPVTQATNDTFAYDGTAWQQVATPMAPQTLWPLDLVWDQGRSALLLHGEVSVSMFPPRTVTQSWTFDGSTWTQLAISPVTGGRLAADTLAGTVAWIASDSANLQTPQIARFDLAAGAWTPRPQPPRPTVFADPIAMSVQWQQTIAWLDGFPNSGRTWILDGNGWRERNPAASPPGRLGSALAEVFGQNQMVLFGGLGSTNQQLGDTWTFDGTTWALAVPANAPSPREGAAVASDLLRQSVWLFGGFDGQALGDTWEWNGLDWTLRATTGPAARSYGAMAHDPQRARVLLYGGADLTAQHTDTWEWDSTVWRQVGSNGPAMWFSQLVHDAGRRRTLLHGRNAQATTWTWNGSSWLPLASGPAGTPLFDFSRNRVVLHTRHDTAVLTPTPADIAARGTGCAGSNGPPELVVYGRPIVDRDALSLGVIHASPVSPMLLFTDLAASPRPLPGGCTLWLPQPFWLHWQLTDAGGSATFPLPLRGAAPFVGMELWLQAAVLDQNGAFGNLLALTSARGLRLGE
ncbi:MAG: hypothetical protein IPK26_07685 [Planctomycetes bacterium]|nr:hypothetical protein [Planctomycetota bacterium]